MEHAHSHYGAVLITTTPTMIVDANPWRKEIILTNASQNVVVFIGMDKDVTILTGTPFYENQTRGHARGFGTYLGAFWGVCASSADVRFWETT